MVQVESDQLTKFKSKPLTFYRNNEFCLQIGRLPDLRFQEFNIETKIHHSVTDYISSNEFLGLLIGPTGCGKTHEMLDIAKQQYTIFIDAQRYPAPKDLTVLCQRLSQYISNHISSRQIPNPK